MEDDGVAGDSKHLRFHRAPEGNFFPPVEISRGNLEHSGAEFSRGEASEEIYVVPSQREGVLT